jgi:hypothetical protein
LELKTSAKTSLYYSGLYDISSFSFWLPGHELRAHLAMRS